MSIENFLNYSVDNTIINHYLKLLAERDVIAAKRNTDLIEQLRLSDAALIEARKSFRLAEEAKAKLVKENPSTKANGIGIGQFIAYSNGTLLDNNTGLMWCCYAIGQQWLNGDIVGDAKRMDWPDAKQAPALFNRQSACGFNDWRLPSIDDFPIIKDKSNSIYGDDNIFSLKGYQFWSCSQYDKNFVMIAEFLRGSDSYKTCHVNQSRYVRLVRGKRT